MVSYMNMEKLAEELKIQEQNLVEFIECSSHKQKILVNNDINELSQLLIEEEKLLAKLDSQAITITETIESLAEEFSLKLGANTVSEFLKAVKYRTEVNVKVISLLRNSISDLAAKAAHINEQNKILIEHSRSFIRETILSLVALNNNQLLDRKI